MKHSIRYTASALALTSAITASLALAEDKTPPQKPNPKMEEMMKKAETAGKPGAAHQALAPLVGEWTAEVKSWMTPGEPPMVTQATAKTSWAMDGRFIREEFTGEFMGKPFHGLSFTGYDNVKQKYSNVWMDDMHSTMFTSEGSGDAKGITLEGRYDCPMTGEKDKRMKQVIRILRVCQEISVANYRGVFGRSE